MNWSDYFVYDSASGELIWKTRPIHLSKTTRAHGAWNTRFSGRTAGHLQGIGAGAAKYVRVHNKMHKAHRIIWEMHYGPIPAGVVIDHIDGDYSNNRLRNLRTANSSQNAMNRKHSSKNGHGLKGVSWCPQRKKFRSVISVDGRYIQLGRYSTKSQAALAYAKGSLRHHGKFSPFYRKAAMNEHVG